MYTLYELYRQAEKAHQNKDYQHAVTLYSKVIEQDPKNYKALRWLGDVYLELEDYDNAINAFEKALALDDTDADVLNDTALAYYEKDLPNQAVELYLKGIEINPEHDCLHSNLGKALYEMYLHTDTERAKEIAKNWKNTFPNNPEAAFMGSAIVGLNPAEQNIDFVKATFDDFASTFDEKLAELEYKAPELLASALQRHSTHLGVVLDAGCGTGLVAPHVRNTINTIVGVDLSGEMIKKAEQRGIYSDLHTADLMQFLSSEINTFNTIVASDVLCYFGDLKPILTAFKIALKPDGILAFSVEKTDHKTYNLEASGRYKHAQSPLQSTLGECGYNILEIKIEALRMEHGNCVEGLVVIATPKKTS